MKLRTTLLLVTAVVSLATARNSSGQTYRIYGLPDTMHIGQTFQVFGLSVTGATACPNCWFDATNPTIASRASATMVGWGSASHIGITANAAGTTTVYGVVYGTSTMFSKQLVVIGPAPAKIVIFCGVAVCPKADTIHVTQSLQLAVVAYDSAGNVLWTEARTLGATP